MALEDLTPSNRFELALSGDMTAEEASNRIEKILAGADIEPSNRLEYFLKLRVAGGGGGGGGNLIIKDFTPTAPSYSESFEAPGMPDYYFIYDTFPDNVYENSGSWTECYEAAANLPYVMGTKQVYAYARATGASDASMSHHGPATDFISYNDGQLTLTCTQATTGTKHFIAGHTYLLFLIYGG